MTIQGYIPIPRELFADGHWAEEREYTKAEALVYLFAKASYKAGRPIVGGKPVAVQPGQLPASVRYLMQAWKWSNTKVENFLTELTENDTITVEKTTGQNLITITFLATYYADLTEKTTQKRQEKDAEKTAKRQQNDEVEESNKERKQKGEVGASPAPLSFNPSILQSSNPSIPGTEAFELLKRIGQTAADMWVKSGIRNTFQTPAHADLALEWMQYCCDRRKPFASHMELVDLVGQFNRHTLAECKEIMDYSIGRKYTALFFDRVKKNKPSNTQNLNQTDLENSRKNAKTTPSGLKLL